MIGLLVPFLLKVMMAPKTRTRVLKAQQPIHAAATADLELKAKRKRELSLPSSSVISQSEAPFTRTRKLEDAGYLEKRLKDRKVTPLKLPMSEDQLKMLPTMRSRPIDLRDEESASTSSECEVENKGGRYRTAVAKPRRQLQTTVSYAMMGQSAALMPLEAATISKRARDNYNSKLKDPTHFVEKNGLPFVSDRDIDSALVTFFNAKYAEGEGAHHGDYVLAAFMDRVPEFGKYGSRKIPRAWRNLKGWRKLCPSRSRLAYPLPVWCAISWQMVCMGHVQKAVFNLMQVSTYLRPGSLLKLKKMGLVKPTHGITGNWSVVTSLSETSDISKTGTKDDSILMDSPWLHFLGPLMSQLSKGKPLEPVWSFDYSEYLSVFHECCLKLKLSIVPYQARHSGPSIDRARSFRTQEEVRKRGGWMSRSSVARYEKAGRLAATWQTLDHRVQLTCLSAERYLEEIMLGQDYPNIPLP
jgi:hypothetical protein